MSIQMRREMHSLRIDPEMWKALKIMAKKSGLSASRILELWIRNVTDSTEESADVMNKICEYFYVERKDAKRGKA